MKRTLKICAAVLLLLIIGFIILRLSLAHEVNVKLQAIRAAGLPTSGAELNAYYPAVPDNENAALVMTQAFALMRNYPDSRSNEVARFKIPTRWQSLNAPQNQLLAGYVEMNSNALPKVREAVKFPRSRYPVDLTLNADALLPHLPNLQKISAIVSFATMLAMKAQDGKQAADLILLQIDLSHTLNTEPLLISQMDRAKIVSSASQLVELGLNTTIFDEETLLRFAMDFKQIDKSDRSAIGFIGDQAMLLPYFQANWSEILRVMWASDLRPSLSTGIRGRFGWLTGVFDQDELFYLKTMQRAIDKKKLPFPAGQSSYDEIYEAAVKGQQAGYILGPGLLKGMRNALPREAETSAQIRLTITALGVEHFRLAHGQLPKNLDELVPQFLSAVPVDPFDGQPLHYQHLAKGYVIYSVGRDGHDNGGRERPTNIKSSDKTEYDITFTVER